MKYTDVLVAFSEVPDEITLCINISNCPHKCKGCHSPYLQKDIGKELNIEELEYLIKSNEGISCVCFMGGKNEELIPLLNKVKEYNLNTGWYTGDSDVPFSIFYSLDYIKIGPYIEERGSLNNINTNQRFYKIDHNNNSIKITDITYKFWKMNYE